MKEDKNTEVYEDGKMQEQGKEEEIDRDGLPLFVRLNPAHGGMWMDDISGLVVSQNDGKDRNGNTIRNYGRVPIGEDCSRIKEALRRRILVPCDPSGNSKMIKEQFLVKEDTVEALMKQPQGKILQLIDNIRDVELLQKMHNIEKNKKTKDQRAAIMTAIVKRLKSRDVRGVTEVEQATSMVYDKGSGRLVKDIVGHRRT